MKLVRKNQLIEEISVLFAEKGYASLGVATIASKCGITKPTLYYYFKNKEDILASIVEFYGNQLRSDLMAAFEEKSFEDSLTAIVDRFLIFTHKNPSYFRLYLSLVFTPHKNVAYQIVKKEAEVLQLTVEKLISQKEEWGAYVPFLAVSLIGQMNSFATIILNGYAMYSPDISKTVVDLFLRGANKYGK